MDTRRYGNSYHPAYCLAAEERHQREVDLARTAWLLNQSRAPHAHRRGLALRCAAGAWLIRLGERLGGAVAAPAGAQARTAR
jgi:hypothetical protein